MGGNQRLTSERFTGWAGYYTYDPRGSVTDDKGMIWQSYRYDANGDLTFGKPRYNNVYSYNAESYNPNIESQYLRARYYNVPNGNFLTEDSYLGNITDPLTLNRYNYVKSSPLNYMDPSGHDPRDSYSDPSSMLPTYEEIALLGDDYYQDWILRYANAKTTDEKWDLIDEKNALIYPDNSHLITAIEKMIQDLEDGSRQAYSYCIDLKSGYTAGAFRVSSTVDNFILDIISFGNGVYFAGYIDGYEIEVFIRDAEAQANNKEAFDIGYRTGRTAVVISYLAILAGGISSSGTAPGEMAITPEGDEVYINGSAAAQAGIGIIPGTLGSAKAGEGDSETHKNGIYEKADYHAGQTTGRKNPAPKDGQFALDNSTPIGENTTRRVGLDSNGDFVVLDETTSGTFHGHVREWNSNGGNQGLTQEMKNALYKAGYIKSPKGSSFKLTDYAKGLIEGR